MYEHPDYPKYQMKVDGELKWCSLSEASGFYDCGYLQVSIGDFVLETGASHPRPMTPEDRQKIMQLADEISASK